MSNRKLQTETSGFTIIEVMMVLSIAALILLVVFMAVPQLQRSSRNTQRSADASRISSAVNECLSNNNGALSSCLPSSGSVSSSSPSGPILGAGGYLDMTKIIQLTTVTIYAPGTVPTGVPTNVNGFPNDSATAWVFGGYTCNGNGFASAATNLYVVLYNREIGVNSRAPQCLSP